MSESVDIMAMARRSIAFDETLLFLRQYVCKTRNLDILYLDHLVDSGLKHWWVCDMAMSGTSIYQGFTFVECLEWALKQPIIEGAQDE